MIKHPDFKILTRKWRNYIYFMAKSILIITLVSFLKNDGHRQFMGSKMYNCHGGLQIDPD
ncbi:hypothetical protein GIB67_025926 [Kingdonia uniflora]|uniref:Uncharacterized protein n=1 Tax=Kingdonia uniflora TaxID=39325 RepID=A0A7J7NZ02_9MAGN|nr:hypothetical protein GIB67_025926 [Kingdonia uniflora]